MTTPPTTPAEPKKKNIVLWTCLIIFFVVACLAVACLGTLVVVPLITDLNPLGFDIQDWIIDFNPWSDYLEDSSRVPDLPKSVDDSGSASGTEDSTSEITTPEATQGSTSENGPDLLVPYSDLDFPFTFAYPSAWIIEVVADDSVTFYDLSSNTQLFVGRDWLCQGCLTAFDSLVRFGETLEFQAEEGDFEVIDNSPFVVSTGDDAHFNSYEWIDFDGNYNWIHAIVIVVDEYSIYFDLSGDDPDYFVIYRELIKEIGASFSR